MIFRAATLILAASVGLVQGSKDDSYYMAGSGNPNADLKMYWKDADNILTDLDQFSTLYVKFHHCAWTQMKYPDDGNDVDESDLWYQGKTPPMGANAAFSLYGSLSGESFKGCNKNSFIKSFYTNTGFSSFAKSMYYAGVDGFSNYYYSDDDGSGSFSSKCNYGYGIGCSYTYGFAKLKFSGDYCYAENATSVVDGMSDFNQAMNNVHCQQIYDSSNNPGYVYGTPLEVLAYSSACFFQNYWSPEGECPDPYGVLDYYQTNFNAGIKRQSAADPYVYQKKLSHGRSMVKMGIVMFALAAVILLMDRMSVFENFIDGQKRYRTKPSAASKTIEADDSPQPSDKDSDKDDVSPTEEGKEMDIIAMSRSWSDPPQPVEEGKSGGVMT